MTEKKVHFAEIIEVVINADNNMCETIKIGNQTWMLENLKTTSFNAGTPITAYTFKTHVSTWLNLNTPNSLYHWADTSDLSLLYEHDLPFDFYGAIHNHLAI